jgi:drug/metabolite transporter (DMT)-like permease
LRLGGEIEKREIAGEGSVTDIRATAPLLAASMVLGAMAIIGLIDNYVVLIARDAGLWQFHAVRAAMALPMFMALSYLGLGRLWPKRAGRVLARSTIFAFAMLIYFGCLAFLPIAQVVAGLFSSPIFVMIFSALFLKKRVGIFRWTAALVGFAGILLVLRPETGELTWVSALPLLAAMLYATSAIATRAWCEGEDTLTLLFWFFGILGTLGAIGAFALSVFPQEVPPGPEGFIVRGITTPTPTFLIWTLVQAAGSILGVGLLTRGYQAGEASFVAIFEYSLMIFASIWAYLIWGQILTNWAIAGIGVIFLSGAVIALRSR